MLPLSNKLKTPGWRRGLLLLLLFTFHWCIRHDSRINVLVRRISATWFHYCALEMGKLMLKELNADCKALWKKKKASEKQMSNWNRKSFPGPETQQRGSNHLLDLLPLQLGAQSLRKCAFKKNGCHKTHSWILSVNTNRRLQFATKRLTLYSNDLRSTPAH